MLARPIVRLLATVALVSALTPILAACSRGANDIVVAKDIAPVETSRSGPAADEPVDRPETRPADLDANALVVAPEAPPPPSGAAPAPSASATAASPPSQSATPTLKQLIGDVSPASNPDFSAVPTNLGPKGGMYANKEALAAFTRMHEAAKKQSVDLVIISAFRSFNDQKRIWNDKWTGK
ncbi:MAG: D-alanyl-D-alanine carboxypeptidase family protein, partial [Alphaproteobacteria bacterium]